MINMSNLEENKLNHSCCNYHRPINHGLATPFLSYIELLWTLAKRGISSEISSFGNRTNSALSANARIHR